MRAKFQPTFRGVLRASVACGVLLGASAGHAIAAEHADASAAKVDSVDEVVVTGSNIKGVPVANASLTTVTREDLEINGFADIGQAIRSLPVNFGGGFNPETDQASANIGQVGFNRTNASAANLHGLGNGGTLTLVNGRRLPAAGEGIAVDLSMIPVAAIERVEVLADGASAIYGTDAVAGVVNIITRRSFDGTEGRASYGSAEGGLGTFTGSLITGGRIGHLSGVVGSEYYNQEKLEGSKRARSELAPSPFWLYGPTERASYFASGEYELTSRIRLYGDALYMQRTGESVATTDSAIADQPEVESQYYVSSGVSISVGRTWNFDVVGDVSKNVAKTKLKDTTFMGTTTYVPLDRRNELRGIDARGTGQLVQLPAGSMKAAVGTAYREEEISSRTNPKAFVGKRNVWSLYGEINIPLAGEEVRIPLIDHLALNVAGRRDEYSDIGSVTVPKMSLSWGLTSNLELSASYSESFRAPSLYESGVSYIAYFIDAADSGRTTRILYLSGTGAPLRPETSKNFNLGAQYSPQWAPGLRLSANYYNIEYKDRIGSPDPNFAYAFNISGAPSAFVRRSPSSSDTAAALGGARLIFPIGGASTNPALIQAIVDTRTSNIAATKLSGVDLSASYIVATDHGTFDFAASGTYIANFKDQVTVGAPFVQRDGTIFYPSDFRSRTGVQWANGEWSASMYWNHVAGYTDNRIANSPAAIKDWNTFDVGLGYDFESPSAGFAKGVRVLLSATNLFNTAPPLVAPQTILGTSVRPTQWDPANASIIGRFVRVQLTKKW